MNKNRRKQWIINKDFQHRFILYTLMPILATIFIFWMSVEAFFYRMIAIGEKYNIPANHGFYILLNSQKKELTLIFIIFSVLLSVLFFLWSVVLSNRIAGPLYRLNKYLSETQSLEESTKTPLKFRKNDFFMEIPEAFNQFIHRSNRK